jgi:thiamine biosynthesis lipoprotein
VPARPTTTPLLLATAALAWSCRNAAEPAPPARQDAARASAPAAATTAVPRIITRARKCMGTECRLTAFHHDEALVERAFERGFAELDRIEGLTTSWRPDSDISRINAAAGGPALKVAEDTVAVIKKSLWVSRITGGAFDVTVGVYRGLWKFDEDNDGTVPDAREVARRRRLVNWKDIELDDHALTVKLRRPGMRLNVEGIAKGYAVDAAVRAIRRAGVLDFMVHAGGDLFASGRRGDRNWRVGIQDPRAPHGKIIFELPISNQAFNTSGDYERFIIKKGVRYHHILDARTGQPARASRAVTILANEAFTADALDTAIFVLGPVAGMKIIEDLPDVEAVIVDADNRVHLSSGLQDKIVKHADPSPGL